LSERALLKSHMEQLETTGQIKALNAELLAANMDLRETQQQLNALNSQLEERVAKRTHDLAQANEEQVAVNEEMAATNEELVEIQQHLEETNREMAISASRLRMAVESTGLGTWEYLPTTEKLYWSKECRNIFGLNEDEHIDFDTYTRHIHPTIGSG
jgi:PAS domain-containing protein